MRLKTAPGVILATALTFSLSACYETETPVLDKGERAPIAGKYSCQNRISGKREEVVNTEQKEGFWFLANYKYVDSQGSPALLKKLPSKLYLGQSMNKGGGYEYGFVDVLDDKTYLVLIADLMSKGDYIEPLLKKFNIQGKANKQLVRLKGDKRNLIDFFAAHDKSMMMVILKCDKVQ